MALDQNHLLNNALLDLYDTEFPAGSILEIRTTTAAGAESAAGGALLCSITLPASPWSAAATSAKTKNGTWSAAASGTGTAGHYRLKNAADTRRLEGTVGQGSGDLSLDNTSVNSGQTVTVSTFQVTLP